MDAYNFTIFDLQNLLENLPGVDPQSESVREAIGSLKKNKKNDEGDKEKK